MTRCFVDYIANECGTTLLKSKKYNQFFCLGHLEYDKYTLKKEYERDQKKALGTAKPANYFNEEPGYCIFV